MCNYTRRSCSMRLYFPYLGITKTINHLSVNDCVRRIIQCLLVSQGIFRVLFGILCERWCRVDTPEICRLTDYIFICRLELPFCTTPWGNIHLMCPSRCSVYAMPLRVITMLTVIISKCVMLPLVFITLQFELPMIPFYGHLRIKICQVIPSVIVISSAFRI